MKIKYMKKVGPSKYHIILEQGQKIVTYDEVILKYNLLFKKELSQELMETILSETSFYDVYQRVVKYISLRLRSQKEIKTYIEKYQLSEQEEQQLFDKLTEVGLLNDRNFAKAFISDKLYLSSMGPYKIKSELLVHQIDPHIIEEELANIDEQVVWDKLTKLVSKKVQANKKYSPYMLRQKLLLYFRDLGYEMAMIDQCFADSSKKDHSILEKEAEKIIKKLSRKYQGIELERKVKEKLYQKGFDINDITAYLNQ